MNYFRPHDLVDQNLSSLDLQGLDLRGVRFLGCKLRHICGQGVNLYGASLSDTDFTGADLRVLIFRDALLSDRLLPVYE